MNTKTDKTYDLRLICGHWLCLDKRPNPRKVWPDAQMCPICGKKGSVGEIHSPRVEVSRLTAPNAPKKRRRVVKKK